MNRLMDKTVIFTLCLLACGSAGESYTPVAVLLTAAGASAVSQYFGGKRLAWSIIFLTAAMCGAVPCLFLCSAADILRCALGKKALACSALFGGAVGNRFDAVSCDYAHGGSGLYGGFALRKNIYGGGYAENFVEAQKRGCLAKYAAERGKPSIDGYAGK